MLALGVIGGPFLLTMVPLLFLYLFGLAGTEAAWAVFWAGAFASHVIFLPLAVGLVARKRRWKHDIAWEMVAFFSAKIVSLYLFHREVPAVAGDPRAAEAFALYSRAVRQVEGGARDPLRSRPTIERGVALVDELLEDYGASRPE